MDTIESACYGNDKFVAIGIRHNSNIIGIYSTDGINWIDCEAVTSGIDLYSICYGNNKFVAVGQIGSSAGSLQNAIIYSTDGISWTQVPLPTVSTQSFIMDAMICYGDGKFVAILVDDSYATNKIYYSTNGINWSTATLPVSANWKSICYGNGKFLATTDSNIAAYSTNGINWVQLTFPSSHTWRACYGNNKFVAAYGIRTGPWGVIYSFDAINWVEATIPANTIVNKPRMCYGDGKFVAVSGKQDVNYKKASAYIFDKWA